MARLGVFCFPGAGHLNPMIALARSLARRGHGVVFFQISDVQGVVRAAGLEFRKIGDQFYPAGSLRRYDETLGKMKGLDVMRYTLQRIRLSAEMVLSDGLEAVREAKVDALLVDQADVAGGTVAERLGIPFLNIIFHPPANTEVAIPPIFCGWKFRNGVLARLRNQFGNEVFRFTARPAIATVNAKRIAWGMRPFRAPNDFYSHLGQIAQIPQCFDFPRANSTSALHYSGPFIDEAARLPVEFPWDRLNGKPIVYASMGTLQNGFDEVFRIIAEACAAFEIQLVLSLGGGLDPEGLGRLPGNPILVRYAPQLEILKRAALTITHAGLNTTLESLSEGVPLVAIPVGNDQPGVAARIQWTGTGEAVALRRLTIPRLKRALGLVLTQPGYKAAAQRIQAEISRSKGVDLAADLVERLISRRDG
jgi:zeaxanthin glucosyltransferase